MPKPKRNKMEIYNDILSAINLELTNGEARPTRVQILSNLAYDKLVRYLNELENKKMIIRDPLVITEKGQDFLQDYDRI
ncbi:MAG: winged helix-turn-helix domain-containing protein, partial [Thermoproteota archaeon]|nr:winged helix-turn-helix domain-containing protein [Thermoproteota archaeon]